MGNMIEARPARRWSAVAPAITVAILQAVVTVVVYVMWAVDAIHVVGCCGFARSETHRLIFLIPTAIAWLGTLASIPIGYRLQKSSAWVPAAGIVIVVGAYIVSRIVGYAGT
ncbi:membrane protein YdbS with pleckstrin-like domain [Microbacterium sp. SLBN-111]